jgi:hypothetical protein
MSSAPPDAASARPVIYAGAIVVTRVFAGLLVLLINFGLSFVFAMPVTPADPNAYRQMLSAGLGEQLDGSTVDETTANCRPSGCRQSRRVQNLAR